MRSDLLLKSFCSTNNVPTIDIKLGKPTIEKKITFFLDLDLIIYFIINESS